MPGSGWPIRFPAIEAAVTASSILVLTVLATGLITTPIGLSQVDQFRVRADSVAGYQTLAQHFPSGLTDPAVVIGKTDKAGEITQAIQATRGVVSKSRGVNPAPASPNGR